MLSWCGNIWCGKKDDGAAAHFARGDFQAGIVNYKFFKWELCCLAGAESFHDTASDLEHETLGKTCGERRGEDVPATIHAEAAGVQL